MFKFIIVSTFLVLLALSNAQAEECSIFPSVKVAKDVPVRKLVFESDTLDECLKHVGSEGAKHFRLLKFNRAKSLQRLTISYVFASEDTNTSGQLTFDIN